MQDSNNIVYVFGDSHCVIFVGAERNFKTCVCGYDSASISGLNEKTSRLEYGKFVIDTITQQPKTYNILMKLGQVDIEFIMYYKIYIKKEIFTFEEFCETLINKYREFINKILEINKNVIIASINLPSYHNNINVRDYIARIITNNTSSLPEITNIDLKLSDFSLIQLTKNYIYFNELLYNLAKEMNLKFFDPIPLFIDNDTKLLKDEYKDYGHHYKGYNDSIVSNAKVITHNFFHSFFEKFNI